MDKPVSELIEQAFARRRKLIHVADAQVVIDATQRFNSSRRK